MAKKKIEIGFVELVELVVYEMEHILRHWWTKDIELDIGGIRTGTGLFSGTYKFSTTRGVYYMIYDKGKLPGVISGRNYIGVRKIYDKIDLDMLKEDEGYIFQLSTIYSTEELEHHLRSSMFYRDFGEAGGIYLGNGIPLRERVQKYGGLEEYEEWKLVREHYNI